MPEKKFDRSEYPMDVLGQFGLTEKMMYDLPNVVHDRLECGELSPLLPLTIEQPFGYTRFHSKIRFVEQAEGVGVIFSPKLREVRLTNFTDDERKQLLEGKVIVANVDQSNYKNFDFPSLPQGEGKLKSFVQLDLDTYNVVYVPTQIIGHNLQTLDGEFDFSEETLTAVTKGEVVTVDTTDDEGHPLTVTLGVDLLSDHGLRICPGDAAQWEKEAHLQLPRYSFGNDGCWVNNEGMLEYVKEENFNAEINHALQQNIRANGQDLEEVASMQQAQEIRQTENNEEKNQLTR